MHYGYIKDCIKLLLGITNLGVKIDDRISYISLKARQR